jgi:hypothetical protein
MRELEFREKYSFVNPFLIIFDKFKVGRVPCLLYHLAPWRVIASISAEPADTILT